MGLSYKKSKLVQGVGINDASYVIQEYGIIKGKQKIIWICPFYRAWKSMIVRCYSAKFQENRPTYKGCSVTEEWLTFSNFREWMITQDWEGKQLDKDILFQGNKVYSSSNCVFVNRDLNMFLIDSAKSRGEFPIGVCFYKKDKIYVAYCGNPFTRKKEYLGCFQDPHQAHLAWKAKKHEHALVYASLQTDSRITEALRTRYL